MKIDTGEIGGKPTNTWHIVLSIIHFTSGRGWMDMYIPADNNANVAEK